MSKRNRLNPVLQTLAIIMKQFYDNVRGCPFVGNLTLTNFSLYDKSLFMLPQGTIRYTCFGTTAIDDMLVYVSVLFQVDDY